MSQISPRLNLPFLQPSQAQKHVTHNEAIIDLDALSHVRLAGLNQDTPPASPGSGVLGKPGQHQPAFGQGRRTRSLISTTLVGIFIRPAKA